MKKTALLLGSFLLAGTASASPVGVDPSLWIGASFGFGTYLMGDINDDIGNVNAESLLDADEIDGGFAYGVMAGMRLNRTLSAFAVFERVSASSDGSAGGIGIEYDLPANALYGGLQVERRSEGPLKLGLAGCIGLVIADGEIRYSELGEAVSSGAVDGTGALMQGQLVADYHVTERVVLSPTVGFRYAQIREFEINDETVYEDDGSEMQIDYSGLVLRLGLKLILN